MGPVDGYLALAHATCGDLAAASHFADRAEALAQEWQLTAYVDWLSCHRARLRI
jgi:hypothetical protein